LDRHWVSQDVVFNYNSELTGTEGLFVSKDIRNTGRKQGTCVRRIALDWIGYNEQWTFIEC